MEGEKATETGALVTLDILDRQKNPVGKIDLDPRVFDAPVKVHLLHEVVLYQQAKNRAGTACTKTRGEVAGSNKKPWRQKGTGRARSGESGSPLWYGGGVIFGPKPRDFSFKVGKKVRKAALRSAISARRKEDRLLVVSDLGMDEIKTKAFLELLRGLGCEKSALVVISERDDKIERSARNLKKVKVIRAEGLNVRDILYYQNLVMTEDAARKIQEALS